MYGLHPPHTIRIAAPDRFINDGNGKALAMRAASAATPAAQGAPIARVIASRVHVTGGKGLFHTVKTGTGRGFG
jgi:hypothetical protein